MWGIGEEQKAQNSVLLLVTQEVSTGTPHQLGVGQRETGARGLRDLRKGVQVSGDFYMVPSCPPRGGGG